MCVACVSGSLFTGIRRKISITICFRGNSFLTHENTRKKEYNTQGKAEQFFFFYRFFNFPSFSSFFLDDDDTQKEQQWGKLALPWKSSERTSKAHKNYKEQNKILYPFRF